MPRLQALLRTVRMTCTPAFFHVLRGQPPSETQAAAATLSEKVFDTVMDALGLSSVIPPASSDKGKRVRLRFAASILRSSPLPSSR